MSPQDRYKIEKQQAIESLMKLGLPVIPLDVAAQAMPVLPEWAAFQKPRRRRAAR